MEKQEQTKPVRGQNLLEWYEALISAALVLVLIFSFFFRIIQVDGSSMVPTLVNGEVLQEDYIAEPTYLGYDVQFPYTVPEGTVFVMGDNRNQSLDSRSTYVGCIDERDILGKVLVCFMPFTDFGVVK